MTNNPEKRDELLSFENMPFMRPVLDDIKHNPGAEMARYAWRQSGVLALSVGETDTPTPAFIGAAVTKAIDEGHTFYGPVLGRKDLRQEIVAYYKRIYNLSLQPERVIVTSSGTSAFEIMTWIFPV